MSASRSLVALAAAIFLFSASAGYGVDYNVGNFSFENPPNTSGNGGFANQANVDAWGGDAGNNTFIGTGNNLLTADDGNQSVSIRKGGDVRQVQDGATVDGVTKENLPLAGFSPGDTISLTVAYALRDEPAIMWAAESFIALYDSATFDDTDTTTAKSSALASSAFIPEPASRNVWTDLTIDYTVTGTESGFLGIYLTAFDAANPTSDFYQVFYDTVRLSGPAVAVLPGDTDLDGDVDLDDFGAIRDNFLNTGVTRAQGDLNADGIVDFIDFQEVVDNYPFPPPAGGFASLLFGSVPEPSSLILIACALPGLIGRGKRK